MSDFSLQLGQDVIRIARGENGRVNQGRGFWRVRVYGRGTGAPTFASSKGGTRRGNVAPISGKDRRRGFSAGWFVSGRADVTIHRRRAGKNRGRSGGRVSRFAPRSRSRICRSALAGWRARHRAERRFSY